MKWFKWKWWIFAWALNAGGRTWVGCKTEWRSVSGSRLRIKYKVNNHDRCEYITETGIMVIKCVRCGAESIPWRVSVIQAKEWRERHPDQIERVLDYERARTGRK